MYKHYKPSEAECKHIKKPCANFCERSHIIYLIWGGNMASRPDMGSRIVEERKKMNLTRETLAEMIGVSAYYMGQIERGQRNMSFETLIKLTDCLCISLDYLVKGETPNNNTQIDEFIDLIAKLKPKDKELLLDLLKAAMPHLIEYKK